MNKTTEVLKLAEEASEYLLEVCQDSGYVHGIELADKALAAIREALAEPVKQEPVALRNAIKHWAFDCAWGDLTERQIDDLELLVIGTLNAAPVQPVKQEPVMWAYVDANDSFIDALNRQHGAYQTPLYAAPVERQWVDLTCEEVTALIRDGAADGGWQGFATRLQDAFKEKNK